MSRAADFPKLEVGMTVFAVFTRNNRPAPREVTITKVGRKYAETDCGSYRLVIEDWSIDGGDYVSPGKCYPSEKWFNEEVSLIIEWNKFANAVRHTYDVPKTGITIEAIQQAANLLGIKLPDTKK